MHSIHVAAGGGYEIRIKRGQLSGCGVSIRAAAGGQTAALIADGNADHWYGDTVADSLTAAGYRVCRTTVQPGEASKNGQELLRLLSFCAGEGLTRSDVIVALGGGVTGDLAGFAAACYLRGIALVQIPTTLLAMVDSSVGGKTAIDLPEGKNLAGAFYQPRLVLCDPDTLATLPEETFADGMAETIKYGMLCDRALFESLGGEPEIEAAIAACVSIKRDLVEADEHDNGERQLLNLGHTVGHAIEARSGYTISHGRAVAAGMAIITRAAETRGGCPAGTAAALEALLRRWGLPTGTAEPLEALLETMLRDKKRTGDRITLIIPEDIGRCVRHTMPVEQLAAYLEPGLREPAEEDL